MVEHRRLHWLCAATVLAACPLLADAGDEQLYFKLLYEQNTTAYQSSARYRQAQGRGTFLYLDYLDRGGLILGNGEKVLNAPDDSLYVREACSVYSASVNLNPDKLAGKLSMRYDSYQVLDRNVVGFTYFDGSTGQYDYRDAIDSRALQLSYLSYAGDLYLETSYAQTRLQANRSDIDDLALRQIAPGIGTDFNQNQDWALFRAILIDHDASNRLQRKRHSNGFQLKVTHWLRAAYYYPSNLQLGLRTGQALMPVDLDAAAVYTAPAMLTRAWSVAAEWKLNQYLRAMLYAGRENFEAAQTIDNYTAKTLYMNISALW